MFSIVIEAFFHKKQKQNGAMKLQYALSIGKISNKIGNTDLPLIEGFYLS